ncbi:MAG: hypothetical protein V1870_05715 [Candidatus Aenigmatarchaeota archaeon]
MSFLETLGKAIGGFILTLCLISLIFTYGFAEITNYNSLKPVFTDITTNQLNAVGNPDQLKTLIEQQCLLSDKLNIPFDNTSLDINCADIQQSDDMTKYLSGQLFDAFYNKEYDCSVIDCLTTAMQTKNPQDLTILVSAKMHSFLQTLIIFFIAGIIAGLAIIIVSLRQLFSILKTIGIAMIVSGLSFIIILVMKFMVPVSQNSLLGFVENIMNMFIILYAIVFAIGVILFIAGWYKTRKSTKRKELEKPKTIHKNKKNK